MLGRIVATSSIAAAVVLLILLHSTTPATIGPLGILIVFILMYLSVLGALTFLLYGMNHFVVRTTASLHLRRPMQPWSLGHAYYYSTVLALVPVMFIGMQSVGDVGLYDVVLLLLFVVIACIYITKRSS